MSSNKRCSPSTPSPFFSSSCQVFSRGSCGCCKGCAQRRARVHSALTHHGGVATPIETEEAIYGLSSWSLHPASLDNITRLQMTDPNHLFEKCCVERELPSACIPKCNYATFTSGALQAMFTSTDACPISAAAEIQFCAAQGRDHRDCCGRNGVTTTLAGNKCLAFCDQRPDIYTRLDLSYAPCYERFDNMKACFFNNVRAEAEQHFLQPLPPLRQ